MIFPVSSDISLAEIYIQFVKNSILLSKLMIREDVIDKISLLMSISMPRQIYPDKESRLTLLRMVQSLNLLKLF